MIRLKNIKDINKKTDSIQALVKPPQICYNKATNY